MKYLITILITCLSFKLNAQKLPERLKDMGYNNKIEKDTIYILANDTSSSKTLNSTISQPCSTDTIKGILIWHSKKHYNDGNSWCYGYWIGKCGPVGMPVEGLTFIPGVYKVTQGYKNSEKEKEWKWQERSLTQGSFYDYEFKKVPSSQVYGFIILWNTSKEIDIKQLEQLKKSF